MGCHFIQRFKAHPVVSIFITKSIFITFPWFFKEVVIIFGQSFAITFAALDQDFWKFTKNSQITTNFYLIEIGKFLIVLLFTLRIVFYNITLNRYWILPNRLLPVVCLLDRFFLFSFDPCFFFFNSEGSCIKTSLTKVPMYRLKIN